MINVIKRPQNYSKKKNKNNFLDDKNYEIIFRKSVKLRKILRVLNTLRLITSTYIYKLFLFVIITKIKSIFHLALININKWRDPN